MDCPLSTNEAPRRQSWVPYALAGVLFAAYATVSVSKHLRLRSTGYDLGIFEQAVRAYAAGRAPVAELKGAGYNLLGDHFHPALAVLAPAYRLFPSPVTLLIAQALLLAGSAIPITRLAIDLLGPHAGGCIGVAYGLSWGLQQTVWFDFHEVCLAVPLLALSVTRLATGRWGAAVAWAAPLVAVKEDLPATVAAIGGYLLLRRQWRLGVATVLGAVAAGLLIVLVVIPALNPHHAYGYTELAAPTGGNPLARLLTPQDKLWTVLALLAPTGFLALRSSLLLLVLPTLLWRFWGTIPYYWGTGFHYSAVLMPIVFVAFVDGLRRRTAPGPATARSGPRLRSGLVPPARPDRLARLIRLAPAAAAGGALIATVFLPLRILATPARLVPDAPATAARDLLRRIPDGATVAAANRLAPQLTARCQVYLFPNQPDRTTRPEWIAATDPPDGTYTPAERASTRLADLGRLGYRLVAHDGGVLLYHRVH
jgi:Predicted membrane protein (DUF2079)